MKLVFWTVVDLERDQYVWIDAWSDKPMLNESRDLARAIAKEEREDGRAVAVRKVVVVE